MRPTDLPNLADARYEAYSQDIEPGVRRYNVFWQAFEGSHVLPSQTPVSCAPGYQPVSHHHHSHPNFAAHNRVALQAFLCSERLVVRGISMLAGACEPRGLATEGVQQVPLLCKQSDPAV